MELLVRMSVLELYVRAKNGYLGVFKFRLSAGLLDSRACFENISTWGADD